MYISWYMLLIHKILLRLFLFTCWSKTFRYIFNFRLWRIWMKLKPKYGKSCFPEFYKCQSLSFSLSHQQILCHQPLFIICTPKISENTHFDTFFPRENILSLRINDISHSFSAYMNKTICHFLVFMNKNDFRST